MLVSGSVGLYQTTPVEITSGLALDQPLTITLRVRGGSTAESVRIGGSGVTSTSGFLLDQNIPEVSFNVSGDKIYAIAAISSYAGLDYLIYTSAS